MKAVTCLRDAMQARVQPALHAVVTRNHSSAREHHKPWPVSTSAQAGYARMRVRGRECSRQAAAPFAKLGARVSASGRDQPPGSPGAEHCSEAPEPLSVVEPGQADVIDPARARACDECSARGPRATRRQPRDRKAATKRTRTRSARRRAGQAAAGRGKGGRTCREGRRAGWPRR